MKYFLVVLFSLFSIVLSAQDIKLISLKIDTIYELINNDLSQVSERTKEVMTLSKAIDYKLGIGSAHFCSGLYFEHTNQPDSALINYKKAISIYESQNDINKIASTYNTISSLYNRLQNYNLALEYNQKALDIHYKQNDSLLLADVWNNRANFLINKKDSASIRLAIEFYNKAYKRYKTLNVLDQQFSIHINLGIQEEEKKNNALALSLFEKALEIANKENAITQKISARVNLSYLLAKENRLSEAREHLRVSYNLAEDYDVLREKLLVVEAYIHLFEHQEDFKSALIWTKINQKLQEDLSQEKFNLFAIRTETVHKVEQKEQRIKQLILQEKIDKKQHLLLYLSIVLLVIIGISVYFIKRKHFIAQKEISRSKQLLLKEQLKRAELEKKHMNSDLDNRKQHLVNIAVHTTQKNEMLQKILDNIKTISKSKGNMALELSKFRLELKQQLAIGAEIEEFNLQLNTMNNQFYKDLEVILPNLTKNEKKLASLLRLGFTTKEIAITNMISESAVKIARHRLRKKINLGTEISLTDYFKNLKI